MAERRRFKRVVARLKVWCEGDEFTLLSETTNVSRGGLFVRASSAPPPATPLKVTIEDLGAVAQVESCWGKPGGDAARGGFGLHILSFERGAAEYEDYVERLSSRSGEHRISWPAEPDEDG